MENSRPIRPSLKWEDPALKARMEPKPLPPAPDPTWQPSAQDLEGLQIPAPPGLSQIEFSEFKRLSPTLWAAGYQASDEPLLRAYLYAMECWQQARDLVRRDGLLVSAANSQTQAHPALAIVRQQAELLKKLANELLNSPGSRKRNKLELGGEEDEGLL